MIESFKNIYEMLSPLALKRLKNFERCCDEEGVTLTNRDQVELAYESLSEVLNREILGSELTTFNYTKLVPLFQSNIRKIREA